MRITDMIRKWLYHCRQFAISGILALFATVGIIGMSPGQETSSLSLFIRLNKSQYIEKEEITVESILTNKDSVEMVVKEPFGLGLVLTFDIYQLTEDGKEIYIERQLVGARAPAWSPHVVQLMPGGSISSSYDLLRHYPLGSGPGKYKIRGVYHLKDFGSKEYDNPAFQVFSQYMTFEIVAPEGRMLEVFNLLNAVESIDEESALKLIRDYPDSPYVIRARRTLIVVYYQRKDYNRVIEQCVAILDSNPTPMQRALALFEEGMEYYYKGDIKTAIEKMKASGLRDGESQAEEWASATQ